MFDYRAVLKTVPMKFRLSLPLIEELQQWSKSTKRDMGDIANGALKAYKANPQGFKPYRRKTKEGASSSMNWRIREVFSFKELNSSIMEQILIWHIQNAKKKR